VSIGRPVTIVFTTPAALIEVRSRVPAAVWKAIPTPPALPP
jgi:hypothetical protein